MSIFVDYDPVTCVSDKYGFTHRTDFRFAIQDLDRSGQIIPDLYDIAFFCRGARHTLGLFYARNTSGVRSVVHGSCIAHVDDRL